MAFDDGVKTVSGSVAHTDDAATKVPFVSVKCGIAPTLTGKSAIEATQTGKNLANGLYEYSVRNMIISPVYLRGGTVYTVSFTRGVNVQYIYIRKGDTVSLVGDAYATGSNATSFSFTADEDACYYAQLYRTNTSATWAEYPVSNPQIEVGSTATTYEPYTAPTTYTVNLGRTIYGGTADVVNGEGKDTTLRYELDENDSWSAYSGASHSFWHNVATGEDRPIKQTEASESICNYATYSSASPSSAPDFSFLIQGGQRIVVTADSSIDTVDKFKTWLSSHNLVFVCPASTPTDFTFTPITPTPETVGKVNNVYCDTGNTELTYYDNAHGFSEVTVNRTGKNVRQNVTDYSSANPVFFQYRNYYAGQATGYPKLEGTFKAGTYTLSFDTTASITASRVGVWAKKKSDQNWYNLSANGDLVTPTSSGYSFCSVSEGHVTGTVKINEDCDALGFGYYQYGTSIPYTNLMLEVGSTATEYVEPTTPVSKTAYLHKVIYGGQADVVKGTCEPKNLFDDSTFPRTATDNTYYAQFQSNLAEGNKYKIPTIHIEPDVAYVLSFDVECNTEPFNASVGIGIGSYSRDIANANNNTSGRISVPFTLTSALKEQYGDILSFRVPRYSTPREFTFTISNVQLEKASTASEYAPHFEPFSFSPISIGTDEGENTLFANEGDSAITYRKAVD